MKSTSSTRSSQGPWRWNKLESSPAELELRRVHRCVDCGVLAPRTETSYTLISSRYGWRLTRVLGEDGRKVMEWRCPGCFARIRPKRAT